VSLEGNDTIRVFTYAYERFSSPQFSLANRLLEIYSFGTQDFHAQAKKTWDTYLTNIADYADSTGMVCGRKGVSYEARYSKFGDNPTLRN
jgi:hypothetical protein